MKDKKLELAKALNVYIKEKRTQDECTGFIDGFEKCQDLFDMRIVMPELLCLSKNKYQNVTVGKKYKTLFEFDDIYFIYDDKGEKISLTIDDNFEIIAQ